MLTNYRVLFDAYNTKLTDCNIPLSAVSMSVQRKNIGAASTRSVTLSLKQTAWKPHFIFETDTEAQDFLMFVRHHAHLGVVASLTDFFAFSYGKQSNGSHRLSNVEDGWKIYNAVEDYTRIGLVGDLGPFRLYHNNYALSETYPRVFVVPPTSEADASVRVSTDMASLESKGSPSEPVPSEIENDPFLI